MKDEKKKECALLYLTLDEKMRNTGELKLESIKTPIPEERSRLEMLVKEANKKYQATIKKYREKSCSF